MIKESFKPKEGFGLVPRMSHWIWKRTKQDPSTDRPGQRIDCCPVSLHFLWGIYVVHNAPFKKRGEVCRGRGEGANWPFLPLSLPPSPSPSEQDEPQSREKKKKKKRNVWEERQPEPAEREGEREGEKEMRN